MTKRVNAYLRGFGQYFRNGQGTRVLSKLDRFVQERLARYLARCQPKGKRRRRRRWQEYRNWLEKAGGVLKLANGRRWPSNPYRGRANLRWKAV